MADIRYAADVFLHNSLEAARAIILTPEVGLSTDERWERETAWLLRNIRFHNGTLIDFGCGVGRLSKPLVAAGHAVIGVDRSVTMRVMAEGQVQNFARFTAVSPEMLATMQACGFRAQGALAVWVLQHLPHGELIDHLQTIHDCLVPGASFWTLERPERYVPVEMGGAFSWFDDGVNVPGLIEDEGFRCSVAAHAPEDLCAPGAMLRCWIRQ